MSIQGSSMILQMQFLDFLKTHPFKPQTEAETPTPCAMSSPPGFKEHPKDSGSTEPAREEPQTPSASEKPQLECICL